MSGDPFAPGDSLFYDAAGNPTRWKNLTDGSNDSLFWDAENRLTRHKRRASGGSLTFDVQYSYDGFGRRVRRIAGSSDTLYVWDGWHLLAATSNTGTALRKYTYFPGTLDFPLAMRVGSTTTYLRLDGQGNVYQTRTTGGSVQAEYRYRAWGDRYNAATETVASPFTYKAREEDRTTGLVYMRHRYHSPRLERFVNEDPIGTAGGLNTYGFASGMPVDLADPMGLCSRWDYTVSIGTTVIDRWHEYVGCDFMSAFAGMSDIQFMGYGLRFGGGYDPRHDCPPCDKAARTVAALASGGSSKPAKAGSQDPTFGQCMANAFDVNAVGGALLTGVTSTALGRVLVTAGEQLMQSGANYIDAFRFGGHRTGMTIEYGMIQQENGRFLGRLGRFGLQAGVAVLGFTGGYSVGAAVMCSRDRSAYGK